jgi:hypothetical protein
LLSLALASAACAEAPSGVVIRSLQSSGPVAFVCLDSPALGLPAMARPLSDCTAARTSSTDDYAIPHMYALVTQPNDGEVAVVDLTTESEAVLDQDPSVPGANFLPVGARPADIVATPAGMASFVSVGEEGFEGIFALPSDMIRVSQARLTSWPACRLPERPERMILLVDPVDDAGQERPSCDAGYGDPEPACPEGSDCRIDLSIDAELAHTPGRYKLVVTLPSEGGIAVIDAQTLVDQPPGVFGACTIERWLPLEVQLPPAPPRPDPPADLACVDPPVTEGPFAQAYTPLPAGIAHDGRQLYVADLDAPVIHRVDMPTPCEPVELPPLITSSREDPDRIVTTSEIAVSPLTLDLKRYLYAIDHSDEDGGSIMAFDISDGTSMPRPLERPQPEHHPFQPVDRIRFGAPPRALIVLQHQNDAANPETGATLPVRCDPVSDGPGAIYRTSSSYDSGAGPTRLRGLFAFAVLSSGDIVVIDVDDWDAPCRGPRSEHPLYGCSEPLEGTLATSNEFSCKAVTPHQPRSGTYLLTSEGIVDNEPGIAAFPSLFDEEGTLVQPETPEGAAAPRMRATLPVDAEGFDFRIAVRGDLTPLHEDSGQLLVSGAPDPNEHTLAMNLVDPRAHIADQGWTVSYEGSIPGFSGRFASLAEVGDGRYELADVASRFCSRGVVPKEAIVEQLILDGLSEAAASSQAAGLADYAQILSEPPAESDAYWGEGGRPAECAAVTYQACAQAFGSALTPTASRDLRILEATQDRLQLEARDATPEVPLTCCFPYVVEFRVRGGSQWIVVGDVVGFLHHMTAGEEGVCRPSCDPALALLDGRLLEAPADANVSDVDPLAFHNPFFRFAISSGADRSERDYVFRFGTQNAFRSLSVNIGGGQAAIIPTAVRYLEPTGELVVSDGGFEGITLIDLNALQITRQYN